VTLYLDVGAIVDKDTPMTLTPPEEERRTYSLRFLHGLAVQFDTADDLRRLRDLIDAALNEET
jgi:hypothetical protein